MDSIRAGEIGSAGPFDELERHLRLLEQQLQRRGRLTRDTVSAATVGLHAAIEELRSADEELTKTRALAKAEHRRYHDLFAFAPDGYLVTNAAGTVQEANEAAAAMLGYIPRHTRGRVLLASVLKEDRGAFLDLLRRLRIENRSEIVLTIVPRRRPPFTALATVATVRDDNGKVEGLRWFLRDVSAQRRNEKALAASRQQLRALAGELLLAEEKERRRIATGIHDRVSQTLAVARITLGRARLIAPPEQVSMLDEVLSNLQQAINESRSLTFELSPPVLYELGLVSGIEWLAEDLSRRHGLKVNVMHEGDLSDLTVPTKVLLFQAIRELLVNVLKHANATRAQVLLRQEAEQLRVTVRDDGVGFDASRREAGAERNGGFGIFSVRTRLEQLGGSFELKSESGRGTTATMVAPIGAQTPGVER